MMELQVSFSLNSEKRAREITPPRRRSPVRVTQREGRHDHRQNGASPPRHDRECHDNDDRQLVSIESGRFEERSSRSDHHRELHDSKTRAEDQRQDVIHPKRYQQFVETIFHAIYSFRMVSQLPIYFAGKVRALVSLKKLAIWPASTARFAQAEIMT